MELEYVDKVPVGTDKKLAQENEMFSYILTRLFAVVFIRFERLTILLAMKSLRTLHSFLQIGAKVRVHS